MFSTSCGSSVLSAISSAAVVVMAERSTASVFEGVIATDGNGSVALEDASSGDGSENAKVGSLSGSITPATADAVVVPSAASGSVAPPKGSAKGETRAFSSSRDAAARGSPVDSAETSVASFDATAPCAPMEACVNRCWCRSILRYTMNPNENTSTMITMMPSFAS